MEFRKDKLRKLKRIYATPKMMKMAQDEQNPKLYMRCQSRAGLLFVCIFSAKEMRNGRKEPLYEIYINPESDQWVTWVQSEKQNGKWSTAKLENLGLVSTEYWRYYNRDREKTIWQNPEGKSQIKQMLQTEKAGWQGIVEWQERVRKEKIERKEREEQERWDKDMSQIKPVSRAFEKWMEKEVVKDWYIFYDSKKGGAKQGYCTHCQKQVQLKVKPKHNAKGICPVCKKDIIFKVSGKIGATETRYFEARKIEVINGGIVERFFEEKHVYRQNKGYLNPVIFRDETRRVIILDSGVIKSYRYGIYKNKCRRWIETKMYDPDVKYYRFLNIPMYQKNMAAVKRKTEKSSYWCWEEPDISLGDYLVKEKIYPALELIVKVGLFDLANAVLKRSFETESLIDATKSDISGVLGLDKGRIKRLRAMNGSVGELRWLQYEKLANTIWPDEMIKDFGSMASYRHEKMFGTYGFLPAPHNYPRIWRYIKKQQKLCGMDFIAVTDEWDDYVSMAGTMKMDISNQQILWPKNLKQAHDGLIKARQADGAEKMAADLRKKWPKVEKNLKALKKYEYSGEKYCIRAPGSILDIVWEGLLLSHCIHTCDFYFERITNRETYLFFLRRVENPDLPWYTLEVEQSGNIRQKRTVGDNQNEDLNDAIPFLKEFQKVFVQRMTEKEKKLGKKADEKRRNEYKKIREEQKKVWHGRLAGKLLADVLENDFMEVV